MSPELDTLDQLQGGDMKLSIIRRVFPDHDHFVRGIFAMLAAGDITLRTTEGQAVRHGQWLEVLGKTAEEQTSYLLSLTDAGARRIG